MGVDGASVQILLELPTKVRTLGDRPPPPTPTFPTHSFSLVVRRPGMAVRRPIALRPVSPVLRPHPPRPPVTSYVSSTLTLPPLPTDDAVCPPLSDGSWEGWDLFRTHPLPDRPSPTFRPGNPDPPWGRTSNTPGLDPGARRSHRLRDTRGSVSVPRDGAGIKTPGTHIRPRPGSSGAPRLVEQDPSPSLPPPVICRLVTEHPDRSQSTQWRHVPVSRT